MEAKVKITMPCCRKAPTISEVKEKIFAEFEIFYLSQITTSKDNIFSHSLEIEMKKTLRNRLTFMAQNMTRDQRMILLYQDNLLESAYRFCMDKRAANPYLDIDRMLKDWLQYLFAHH